MRRPIARGATAVAAAAALSLAGAPGASAISGNEAPLPDYDAIQGKYSGFTGYEIGCAVAQSFDLKVCGELGNVSPVKAWKDVNDLKNEGKKIKRR